MDIFQPHDRRVFKPIGCQNSLKKLKKAVFEYNGRKILLHGLSDLGKSLLAKYFTCKILKLQTFYIRLPIDEGEAGRDYKFIKLKLNSPNRFAKHLQFAIIIDELEKISNNNSSSLEVIGWVTQLMELNNKLLIGITNRLPVIYTSLFDFYKRLINPNGNIVYCAPHTVHEITLIVNNVSKQLQIEKILSRKTRKEMAKHLHGFTYSTIVKLLNMLKTNVFLLSKGY